jgi:hypothetical protein
MKRFSKVVMFLLLVATVVVRYAGAEEHAYLAEMSLEDILKMPVSYGYSKSPVEVHVFMNTALWDFQKQALGSYANVGAATSGYPYFISYSGYVDIGCQVNKNLYGEAEFELYKGQLNGIKVCKLRQVWTPSENFRLSLGRDFPPIGIQDQVYYPTSQYRLFALSPYLYWSILRATGWWDSGVYTTTTIPLKFIGPKANVRLDAAVIDGPGDASQSYSLVDLMKPNAQGYFYEFFHEMARQPWDNNKNKYIPVRLTLQPIQDLFIGASYADGKYDTAEKYGAAYTFAHLLYGGKKLTVACEYGQLKFDVNPANMRTAANIANGTLGNTSVTQYSYYLSAGYKVIQDKYVHFLEPVVRYEYMNSWQEDSLHKGDREVLWGGFRLSPYEHWVIKAGYCFQRESYGPSLDNDGYIVESVLEF